MTLNLIYQIYQITIQTIIDFAECYYFLAASFKTDYTCYHTLVSSALMEKVLQKAKLERNNILKQYEIELK